MITVKQVLIYENKKERREFRTFIDDNIEVSTIIINNDYDNSVAISDKEKKLLQKIFVDRGYKLIYADVLKSDKYVQ